METGAEREVKTERGAGTEGEGKGRREAGQKERWADEWSKHKTINSYLIS